MENVIASLESKVAPAAVSAGTPAALTVGHINYGKELFDLYAREDAQDTTVKAIIRMADVLTCEQFAEQVEKAQEIATATDAALGFKAPEDAKGAEKYGPKRRLINSRMSEAKQIFGAQKLNPQCLKEKGYWAAVQAARDFLTNKGVKWDGQRAKTAEEKAVARENKENNEAIELAKQVLPQLPGESIKDWMIRCADRAETLKEQARIQKVLDKLEEIPADLLIPAVYEYMKKQGADSMNKLAQSLHEGAEELQAKQIENPPV